MKKKDFQTELTETCRYFNVSEDEILNTSKSTKLLWKPRQVFYTLCLKKGLSLYELSIFLGKHRTSIITSFKEFREDVSEVVKTILNNRIKNESILEQLKHSEIF